MILVSERGEEARITSSRRVTIFFVFNYSGQHNFFEVYVEVRDIYDLILAGKVLSGGLYFFKCFESLN